MKKKGTTNVEEKRPSEGVTTVKQNALKIQGPGRDYTWTTVRDSKIKL